MKKLFIAVALLVAGSAAHAQSEPKFEIDNAGNYVELERSAQKDTATGRFYVDKDDNLYPVYRTRNGKLYALLLSKAGKTYRYYLVPTTEELDFEPE